MSVLLAILVVILIFKISLSITSTLLKIAFSLLGGLIICALFLPFALVMFIPFIVVSGFLMIGIGILKAIF